MYRGSYGSRLRRSAAFGAILTALSIPAFAQATDPAAEQVIQTTPPAEEESSQAGDVVIITGSRLPSQFSSTSPMDIIAADEAASQGIADVASLLRNSTVAAGSSQITAVTSTAFVQDGGIGAESISLRGLGANRTLVLLDGRRAGPAGTRGSVGAFDLNVIPLSAIERVEILKDGASSIYGSDAVAGVVNIITKKDDGGDIDMFYSGPIDGGGEQFRINGSYGATVGQGRFRITADYFNQKELARGDRDFFACAQPYVFNNDGSRADLVDPRTGKITCSSDLPWGHVWFYDYNEPGAISQPWQSRPQLIQYDYDNNMAGLVPPFGPMANNFTAPPGWFPVAYGELSGPNATPDPYYGPFARTSEAITNFKHPFQDLASLSPEVERMTVYGSGEYDVSDSMTLYGEALLNRRMTKVNGYRQFWTYQYVYDYGYGYVYGDPMAISQGWVGDFVGLSPLSITDHSGDVVSVDYARVVAGAKGEFGQSGWVWDASFQFSRSDGDYKSDIIWDDAITPYEFQSSLCAGTQTPYRGVDCVDINWYDPEFLRGNISDQDKAFLFGTVKGNTIYEQTSFEATTNGTIFDLPAGPVGLALGVLYQDDRILDTPSQVIQDGQAWGSSSAGVTEGNDDTRAVFGEVAIPIFRDVPGAKELSFTASGRFTDVASYGGESTYKLGLSWEPIPSLRFRATQGTSFRSPALFELFLANETGFFGQREIDPCINWQGNLNNQSITQRVADNCAADGVPPNHNGAGSGATVFSSGGYGSLTAETSLSRNFGVIWSPEFINLQVSVDYFDIEISNEVTKLGAANILLGCYSSENFATEPLCDLFERNPAGGGVEYLIDNVTDNFLNIATQTNRGIDFDAIYTHELAWGDLSLRVQASHQLEDEIQLLPTSRPTDFNGEIGDPETVANFDATFDTGPWSFYYGARYVGETSNVESFGTQNRTYLFQPVRYVLETDAMVYHNISVARDLPAGMNLRLGVSNVLDETPPFVTNISGEYQTVGNVPLVSQYDFFGRTVFVNLTKKF